MKNFKFSYDSENDDLFVFLDGKTSAGGVELGNFILDFDSKGNLVAMQILNAADILSKVLAQVIELSKITEIKIEMVNVRNMNAIQFNISDGTYEGVANILVPHIKEKSPVLFN
jgi:uncharacterized protein YuzE